MAQLKFNTRKFTSDIHRSFKETIELMGDRMQEYLVEERRTYPRTTIRKFGEGITGKIATSPRDVVDSGDLIDSYSLNPKTETRYRTLIDLTWGAPYAEFQYFGTSTIPPYPWTAIALQDNNLYDMFWKIYKRKI